MDEKNLEVVWEKVLKLEKQGEEWNRMSMDVALLKKSVNEFEEDRKEKRRMGWQLTVNVLVMILNLIISGLLVVKAGVFK
jgi:hypothetical protein